MVPVLTSQKPSRSFYRAKATAGALTHKLVLFVFMARSCFHQISGRKTLLARRHCQPEFFARIYKIGPKVKTLYKSGKFLDSRESCRAVWKVSRQSGKFPDSLGSFRTVGKLPDSLGSSWAVWKVSRLYGNF